MATNTIYKFHVELEGYVPKMWRRFEVDEKTTLSKLGYILMTLFEMKAQHLFEFKINLFENYFVLAKFLDEEDEEEEGIETLDISRYRIKDILDKKTKEIVFQYDLGANWTFKLTIEDIYQVDSLKDYPRVLEGEGFGIVEDAGGVYGLMDMVEIFKTKRAGYEELANWLGENELDLSKFDIEDMNFRLKKLPRIFRDIYECDLEPTQQSINLIERKYMKK